MAKLKALTKAEMRRAISWGQDALGIQDWYFRPWLMDDPPDWVDDEGPLHNGSAASDRRHKRANVWVSNRRSIDGGRDPVMILFHEMLHVACEDAGIRNHGSKPVEAVLHKLERILVFAYRHNMQV